MVETRTEPAPSPPPTLYSMVGRVAGIIGSEDFPTGDRARLRRLDPDEPPPIAFYRFAFRHLPEEWERSQADWITMVSGMALMAPRPHQPGMGFGRVLAENNYSEARLERMLAAEGNTLRVLVLRAVRFLVAKGAKCDWTDIAAILLARGGEKREQARFRIARDFYRAARAAEHPKNSQKEG